MKTSIFIKSYKDDYKWLRYCLESIAKFVTGYEQIVVVIPEDELPHLLIALRLSDKHYTRVTSKTSIVYFGNLTIAVKEVEEHGNPYLFQQVVKMEAWKYTDSEIICYCDSDCVFSRPVNISEYATDKPLILFDDYENVGDAKCWKEITEKTIGHEVNIEFMRQHPFIYLRSTVQMTCDHIERLHGVSVSEYILSQPGTHFSEFNAVGAYAYLCERDNYRFAEARQQTGHERHVYNEHKIIQQWWSYSGLTKEELRKIYEILYDFVEFTEEGHAIVKGDTHIGQWVKENRRLDFDLSATPKFLEMVKEGDVVVDCGANIGAYAHAFAEKIGESGKLFCFEPNPKAFKCLEYNMWGRENVVLINAAVGLFESEATMSEMENTGASFIDENGTVPVRVVSLDNELYGEHVNVIKIDCEGTEEYVLRGANKVISEYRPKLILEINDGCAKRYDSSADNIKKLLIEYGYIFKNIYDNEPMEGDQYDIMCWHGDEVVKVLRESQEQFKPQPVKTISFKHMGNAGDIIFALSGMKTLCNAVGAKAKIFIWLDRPAHYYDGAYHPTRNFKGQQVTMNHYMFKMIKPLLEAVDFVEEVAVFEGQEIDVDLDRTHEHKVGKPYGDIRRWYNYIFAGMWADLNEQIIHVEADVKGEPYVLVNRTQRYYNPMGSYAFLRNIGLAIIFAGTPEEYEEFQREVPEARYLEVDNFLELAGWIKGSQFFIGNQSMCFAIAEQMKHPRILEVCEFAPNVIPQGGRCCDWKTQSGFEIAVRREVELCKK